MTATDINVRASPSNEDCKAVVRTLARIGDKWTVLVVGALSDGPKRYNEIQRRIDGISQRMLTLTLKGLESNGLVTRTMFATIPPRVDYELTDLGRSLTGPVNILYRWASEHRLEMEEASRRYAAREL